MAPRPSEMTRSSSSDSSALSNINVAGAQEDDSASEHAPASTPPTSLSGDGSTSSSKFATESPRETVEAVSERRASKRARAGPATYNLKQKFDAMEAVGSSSSRNVSGLTGKTLVDEDEDDGAFLGKKTDDSMAMDWESTAPRKRQSASGLQRQLSVKDKAKGMAKQVSSVLGKRSREIVQAGKRKLGMSKDERKSKQDKLLKELDMGAGGVLDDFDLSDIDTDMPPPPAKRLKVASPPPKEVTKPTAPPVKIINGKQTKKWHKHGLYVGQTPQGESTTKTGRKKLLKKQRPGSSGSDGTDAVQDTASKPSFMPLPMYGYLDRERNFVIPYDIYAPTGDVKPKDWKNLEKNRLVGDAKEEFELEKLPSSFCTCKRPAEGEQGCGDDCHNRVMSYECTEQNCRLRPDECSNRAFAELAARTKKGGLYDKGVEIIRTDKRGYGIRACRTFAPGQIIMEYTGELITEGECQRRMRELYKDKDCYYLMELEGGLIIDGTKGSKARFINHSCSPNCEVRMLKVDGTPRMAIFAGEDGIMTGDELTYDYNFDNFGATQQKCYCGAPNCRGTLSKRLNAAEQKKQAKVEEERKRKAAAEIKKNEQEEERKKKVKTERGSTWVGWVDMTDPAVRAEVLAEKKRKEEEKANSERSRRRADMLQRREDAKAGRTPVKKETKPPPRGRSTKLSEQEMASETKEEAYEAADATADAIVGASILEATSETTTRVRTFSTGSSKFHEELSRPTSALTRTSTSTIIKQTEVSISRTEITQGSSAVDEETNSSLKNEVAEDRATKAGAKSSLTRTASKGKGVLKSVGEAVKKSLLGFEKPDRSSVGGGKLKQSTLNFAKVG